MRISRWQIGLLVATALVALAAAGCTGTDVLDSGNSQVTFEVAVQGMTTGTYDCLNFEWGNIRIRPLTGTCGPGSAIPGEPCLGSPDCGGGTCENSEAGELIGNNGVLIVANTLTVRGNLMGEPCEPTTAGGGFCSPGGGACMEDSDCVDPNPNDSIVPQCFPTYTLFVKSDTFVPLPARTVSEGLYEISQLNIENISLYTDDPLFLGRCGDFITLAAEFGTLRFTMERGQDQVVRLVIDLAALEQALPGPSSCGTLNDALSSVFSCEYGPLDNPTPCIVP